MGKDNKDFFKKQTASSLIKSKIVAEYFPQYCRIILRYPQEEIRYLDLFAGPGIYEDGSLSTPILLSQHIANDPRLKTVVQLAFNDKYFSKELEENFWKTFKKDSFDKVPRFANKTVGEDSSIQEYLARPATKKNKKPTLLFFDPWGYKGIDTATLANFLEHWGNEIFLFINIKRINAATENNKFEELMRALFPKLFDRLRFDKMYKSSVYDRLCLIMDNIAEEFQSYSNSKIYHAAFRFQEEDSRATSHYIVHFTKHPKGYELAKQIYNDYDNVGSSLIHNGDYSFDAKLMYQSQHSLFGTDILKELNVESLSGILYNTYRGKKISARKLFDEHHINGKFCGTHYAQALRILAEKDKLVAIFTDNINHKVSVLLTEDCILTFK